MAAQGRAGRCSAPSLAPLYPVLPASRPGSRPVFPRGPLSRGRVLVPCWFSEAQPRVPPSWAASSGPPRPGLVLASCLELLAPPAGTSMPPPLPAPRQPVLSSVSPPRPSVPQCPLSLHSLVCATRCSTSPECPPGARYGPPQGAGRLRDQQEICFPTFASLAKPCILKEAKRDFFYELNGS